MSPHLRTARFKVQRTSIHGQVLPVDGRARPDNREHETLKGPVDSTRRQPTRCMASTFSSFPFFGFSQPAETAHAGVQRSRRRGAL